MQTDPLRVGTMISLSPPPRHHEVFSRLANTLSSISPNAAIGMLRYLGILLCIHPTRNIHREYNILYKRKQTTWAGEPLEKRKRFDPTALQHRMYKNATTTKCLNQLQEIVSSAQSELRLHNRRPEQCPQRETLATIPRHLWRALMFPHERLLTKFVHLAWFNLAVEGLQLYPAQT